MNEDTQPPLPHHQSHKMEGREQVKPEHNAPDRSVRFGDNATLSDSPIVTGDNNQVTVNQDRGWTPLSSLGMQFITYRLRGFAGTRIDFTVPLGQEDKMDIANQMCEALLAAGWVPHIQRMLEFGEAIGPEKGMFIYVRSRTPAAQELGNILAAVFGIGNVSASAAPNAPDDRIIVYVRGKKQNYQPFSPPPPQP